MHDRWPRFLAAALLTCLASASRLAAQGTLGHLDDPTTAPKNHMRLRVIAAWTRYDSRFTTQGVEPLGALLSADSLGPSRFAPLAAVETGIRQAAQISAFGLTLGRSRLDATAREEVVPLALEYGLTDRLAFGVVVPIVRRRVTTLFQLDSTGANVGPNLHRTSQTAAQTNALVQTEFANAATQLQSRLTSCQQDPSGPGCGQVLAQAPALLAESQSFASLVASLYGSSGTLGMAFVPRDQSAAQNAIELRVVDFNGRYRALLGTDVIQAAPVGAAGPTGASEFHTFVVDELGRDSLSSQERLGIGDIEIGVKFRMLDRPVTETRRLGVQLALAGSVHLPTGSRERASEVLDLRLGHGDPVGDVRALLDMRAGRLGLLATGQVRGAIQSAMPLSTVPDARDASWIEVHAAPRWHLSESFALHGAYSYRKADVTGSDQLAGGGVSLMTLGNYLGSAVPPLEMRFTHLEAIRGTAGKEQFFRDQVEVRIYYRLWGRKRGTAGKSATD